MSNEADKCLKTLLSHLSVHWPSRVRGNHLFGFRLRPSGSVFPKRFQAVQMSRVAGAGSQLFGFADLPVYCTVCTVP